MTESLKRQRLLDDLRANAFAMPKATMKLLMALPLLTVLLGEGMGVHHWSSLFQGSKAWHVSDLPSVATRSDLSGYVR